MGLKVDPTNNIPTTESKDQTWILWHKAMVDTLGKKQANVLFLKCWNVRNKDGALNNGIANTKNLREYMDKQGVKIDQSGISMVADFVDDTFDSIGNMLGFTGKATIAVIAIIFLVIVWAFIRIMRNPNDYSQLLTMVATRGAIKK